MFRIFLLKNLIEHSFQLTNKFMKKSLTKLNLLVRIKWWLPQRRHKTERSQAESLSRRTRRLFGSQTVWFKGTTVGVVTDLDGNYSLQICLQMPTTLVISYIG